MRPMDLSRVGCLGLFLLLMRLSAAMPGAAAAADAEFTIEARDFDGGNARVSLTGEAYADGPSCIWNAGELPNWAEYEIEFPVTADYTLSALYAAAQARPVEIRLDDKQVHVGFQGATGNWNTSSARWEEQCKLPIARGTHTIALRCEGPFPHICALRLKSSAPFPAGWQLPRPTPEQRAERMRRAAE
ncbi:MAG: carbohydrate-binding protein, partial [Pirellulales bacterium]|nr:carbohydrate-binding protein [Pirellulales bacterium]